MTTTHSLVVPKELLGKLAGGGEFDFFHEAMLASGAANPRLPRFRATHPSSVHQGL